MTAARPRRARRVVAQDVAREARAGRGTRADRCAGAPAANVRDELDDARAERLERGRGAGAGGLRRARPRPRPSRPAPPRSRSASSWPDPSCTRAWARGRAPRGRRGARSRSASCVAEVRRPVDVAREQVVGALAGVAPELEQRVERVEDRARGRRPGAPRRRSTRRRAPATGRGSRATRGRSTVSMSMRRPSAEHGEQGVLEGRVVEERVDEHVPALFELDPRGHVVEHLETRGQPGLERVLGQDPLREPVQRRRARRRRPARARRRHRSRSRSPSDATDAAGRRRPRGPRGCGRAARTRRPR